MCLLMMRTSRHFCAQSGTQMLLLRPRLLTQLLALHLALSLTHLLVVPLLALLIAPRSQQVWMPLGNLAQVRPCHQGKLLHKAGLAVQPP